MALRSGTPLPSELFPRRPPQYPSRSPSPDTQPTHPLPIYPLYPDLPGITDPLTATEPEILAILATHPSHSPTKTYTATLRLSPSIICKTGPAHALANQHANHVFAAVVFATAAGVSVPKVLRFFVLRGQGYLFLRHEEGERLDQILAGEDGGRADGFLPLVAEAVRHMQGFSSPVPGPVGGGPVDGWPWGFRNTGARFVGFEDLEGSFVLPAGDAGAGAGAGGAVDRIEFADKGLVFVHRDLLPKKILVKRVEGGVLGICILDWEMAGHYPAVFEYGALRMGVFGMVALGYSDFSLYTDYMKRLLRWLEMRAGGEVDLVEKLERYYRLYDGDTSTVADSEVASESKD